MKTTLRVLAWGGEGSGASLRQGAQESSRLGKTKSVLGLRFNLGGAIQEAEHICPRFRREAGAGGKDLGVIRKKIVVKAMGVDEIREKACV